MKMDLKNVLISIIGLIWIFIFMWLTAMLDDYYTLGWWWNLMLFPSWFCIIYIWRNDIKNLVVR